MYAKDYRKMAREVLKGKWKKMAWLVFLAGLLGAVVGVSGGVSFGGFDISAEEIDGIGRTAMMAISAVSVAIGLWCIFMGSWVQLGLQALGCRVMDGEAPKAAMLFPKGVYRKALLLYILRGLFIALWSLLFIIPGIMAAYSYAMADYILYNHPEMSAMEALRESKRLMHGRKGRLFGLDLSFIGWSLLCFVPLYVLAMIAAILMTFMMPQNPLLLLDALLLPGLLVLVIAVLFVQAYRLMAYTAFYRNAHRCGEWKAQMEDEDDDEYEDEDDGETDDAPANSGRRVTSLTADETVAKDIFWQHNCSRKRLAKENMLEEYQQMGVNAYVELRWLREYGNTLMQRFDRNPDALDDILELCAEYGMDDLLSRTLERIERHIRQESLPETEILNMAGRVLALTTSGVFDDQPDYVRRKRSQVSDIADRMEHRLKETDPDGDWGNLLELVRSLCGEER